MTGKLTSEGATDYWTGVHDSIPDSLSAVCYPHKPWVVNAFFDVIQQRAVSGALSDVGIRLAGADVLEIGSGRGRWLSRFRRWGARSRGVDISAEAVAVASSHGLDAVVASAGELPHADDSFDVVVSITVMIHLDPALQERAANEMQRVCRSGGHVLLLEGTATDPSPHVWTRTPAGWVALFADCGEPWVEGHYFAPALRMLWASPLMKRRPRIVSVLEHLAIAYSLPLEILLMRLRHGRPSRDALQHVIALRKR